jgi:hypothetical protein
MKKGIKYFTFGLLLFIFSYENCFAVNKFCQDANVLRALRVVGVIIFVTKILVPAVIIVTGIISLAKAVIAGDESEIKKSVSLLMVKIVAGVIIAFTPTIIYTSLKLVEGVTSLRTEFGRCTACTVNLTDCDRLIREAP